VDLEERLAAAREGDRRSIGRLLSLAESGEWIPPSSPTTEEWSKIGLTGAPGVGKSTIANSLASTWINSGIGPIAILAVDPSSPRTGGALLGDRVRMSAFTDHPDAFVRSVASRGSGGGLSSAVEAMSDALIQCGFRRIIIETVGTGQYEVRAMAVCDRLVLVEGPGRGDAIQAEKAGVLEVVDAVVVTRSDDPSALLTAQNLEQSLVLEECPPPVFIASGLTGEGVETLADALANLSVRPGTSKARARASLLAESESFLLNHSGLDEAIDRLCAGSSPKAEFIRLIAERDDG